MRIITLQKVTTSVPEPFETFSRNFRMAEFWAPTIILFAFALLVAELIEKVESKVEFYAGERQ